jgi:hypothetical protein
MLVEQDFGTTLLMPLRSSGCKEIHCRIYFVPKLVEEYKHC